MLDDRGDLPIPAQGQFDEGRGAGLDPIDQGLGDLDHELDAALTIELEQGLPGLRVLARLDVNVADDPREGGAQYRLSEHELAGLQARDDLSGVDALPDVDATLRDAPTHLEREVRASRGPGDAREVQRAGLCRRFRSSHAHDALARGGLLARGLGVSERHEGERSADEEQGEQS